MPTTAAGLRQREKRGYTQKVTHPRRACTIWQWRPSEWEVVEMKVVSVCELNESPKRNLATTVFRAFHILRAVRNETNGGANTQGQCSPTLISTLDGSTAGILTPAFSSQAANSKPKCPQSQTNSPRPYSPLWGLSRNSKRRSSYSTIVSPY